MEPFTRQEAEKIYLHLLAGWRASLNEAGTRTLLPGAPGPLDEGGSYEGVTRMLWALGGWLARPGRADHGERELLETALRNGLDRAHPDSWWREPRRLPRDQRSVEAATVAWACVRAGVAPDASLLAFLEEFGKPLPWWSSHRPALKRALRGRRPGAIGRTLRAMARREVLWPSNWAVFWLVNHAARGRLGWPCRQETIRSVRAYLRQVAAPDGLWDDAPALGAGHFDDYNGWTFVTHALSALEWGEGDDRTRAQVQRQMEWLPLLFAADGGYPEYGRSALYRWGRLAGAVAAYRHGLWPHGPGLLRRLVGLHLAWYLARGAARPDGALRSTLTEGGSEAVREAYASTGSPYWSMILFGELWTLEDDSPFWTAPEEPLPAERGGFVRVLPGPGWVLVGHAGEVFRYNAGSRHYPVSYGKFAYASDAPYRPERSPDSMLSFLREGEIGHRDGSDRWAVGEPGWLRFRWRSEGRTVETVIVPRGSAHLRVHRLDRPAGRAVEGGYALGHAEGERPEIGPNEARVGDRRSVLIPLAGYAPDVDWRRHSGGNLVYPRDVLPTLTPLPEATELACVASTAPLQDRPAYAWEGDALAVRWGGDVLTVPPLV